MKITTPLQANVTTAATAAGFNNTNNLDRGHSVESIVGRKSEAPTEINRLENLPSAETALKNRIKSEGGSSGKELIRFCRELSVILIRSYQRDGENTGELREKLTSTLKTTLNCTEKQALCLIELSLELIHAKIHGQYKRSEIDLGYLIATATGAVGDVSAN